MVAQIIRVILSQVEPKVERRSLVYAFGCDRDLASILGHKSLANGETQANTVHVVSVAWLQFTEVSEQALLIVFRYAYPSVLYRNIEPLLLLKIVHYDLYLASIGELKRVLNQIDQYLLKTTLISN